MNTFRVYYTYPNDPIEYAARIEATDAHAACVKFRDGLQDDELGYVTITKVTSMEQGYASLLCSLLLFALVLALFGLMPLIQHAEKALGAL